MRSTFLSRRFWLLVALALTVWALWPGLSGGFLFDDDSNLEALGAYGAIHSPDALARYITSGTADPTGRPVAMLSFLLDARNWPADPYPFKRTNLLLHLLNGLLLFAMLAEVGRNLRIDDRQRCRSATLAAALWLLHPLFLSTTMYVVQREAMLPATFTFSAAWVWLIARRRLLEADDRLAPWCMASAIVVGTTLATLSKANGALLPALLLVVEGCLPETDALRMRPLKRWLLWCPTIALFVALFSQIPANVTMAETARAWTLGQRMLTEPRILFDYLSQLFFPRPFSRGLFNDSIVPSRSLWEPWTTAPALLGLIALALIGWHARKRTPMLAMAIGFYLVGQSIESGPVALELYFEHRNYLPAALLFWPLALWLTGPGARPKLRTVLAFALPLLLAAETRIGADLWGDPTQQALVWGAQNPDSPRAQAYAAQYELGLGMAARAERRLRQALASHPDELQLLANLVDARCAQGELDATDQASTLTALESRPDPNALGVRWLTDAALPMARAGSCKGFGIAQADAMVLAFARNPRTNTSPGRLSDAEHLLGEVALAEGNPAAARAAFDRAYDAEHRVDAALVQAAELASAGQSSLALGHLDRAKLTVAKPWYQWRHIADVHRWVLDRQGFWQAQVSELRAKLVSDSGSQR